jgi:hypothetical protein
MLDKPQDEYYHDRASRLNTIVGDKAELWTKIHAARMEYTNLSETKNKEEFNLWLRNTYGIELKFKENMVSLDADIIDKQKYTMFLLRF